MSDRHTPLRRTPEMRQRLRDEAQYLRARAYGIQQTSWALQRRAQDLRVDTEMVQELAACARHHAAIVWDAAGWLIDVELEAASPLLGQPLSTQRQELPPCQEEAN